MSSPPDHFDRDEREIEFSRTLAFSDGVFAFAITLLVTTIDVPRIAGDVGDRELQSRLDELLPFIGSYFLSFLIVGLLWLRHHRLFSRISRLDSRALSLNLLLLSLVALMPFSTEVMGRYGDLPSGLAIYALNLAAAGFAFTWLWWYCARHEMLGEELTPEEVRRELLIRLTVPAGFLLSIPVAFASVTAAQAAWVLTLVAQRFAARVTGGG